MNPNLIFEGPWIKIHTVTAQAARFVAALPAIAQCDLAACA
jgi:hypothetical protein